MTTAILIKAKFIYDWVARCNKGVEVTEHRVALPAEDLSTNATSPKFTPLFHLDCLGDVNEPSVHRMASQDSATLGHVRDVALALGQLRQYRKRS